MVAYVAKSRVLGFYAEIVPKRSGLFNKLSNKTGVCSGRCITFTGCADVAGTSGLSPSKMARLSARSFPHP